MPLDGGSCSTIVYLDIAVRLHLSLAARASIILAGDSGKMIAKPTSCMVFSSGYDYVRSRL